MRPIEYRDNLMVDNGNFVISLDYELMWGVRDSRSEVDYGPNILNVGAALEQTIALCIKYNISLTIATVGFLFHKNAEELMANLPDVMPQYQDTGLSPFVDTKKFLKETKDEKLYFDLSTTQRLIDATNVEMASHTYSHFYCLDAMNSQEAFKEDTALMDRIAKKRGVDIQSIVFPRNQYTQKHIHICDTFGIQSFRGNPKHWIYKPSATNDQSLLKRFLRLLDAYMNITGHNCVSQAEISQVKPHNIAASRFLRPYSKKLCFLEKIKIKRIKKSMTHAAKNKLVYHLWWHPHNFGANLEENLKGLTEIFEHYQKLKYAYGFSAITMAGLSNTINRQS